MVIFGQSLKIGIFSGLQITKKNCMVIFCQSLKIDVFSGLLNHVNC